MSKPNMPPWSHSTLTSFETCPKRHYLTKVTYEVVEPQTEATKWGNTVHKALEMRALNGDPLPLAINKYEPLVDKIVQSSGDLVVEHKMAIDKSFAPTEWKTSWARGIVDIGKIKSSTAALFDWKTGKRKVDSDQMKLMALLTMQTYENVDQVETGFVWLKENKIDRQKFTREQIPDILSEFLPRVARLEKAYEKNDWKPKPSGLCKAWCPCTGCSFNGKYKGK